jgi:threonine/homoserine/homoserine lactone efflux protein
VDDCPLDRRGRGTGRWLGASRVVRQTAAVLWQVVGSVLPSAAGVALSPIPVIAIVVLLDGPRPRARGVGFALGWAVALAVVMTIVVALTNGADDTGGGTYLVVEVLRIAAGAAFLVLAFLKWWKGADADDAEPGWMSTLGSASPRRATSLGAALAGLNPKNLALAATAAASIGESGLDAGAEAMAIAVFVVLGSATVFAAVGARIIGGEAAAPRLASTKEFMLRHSTAIAIVILVILGAKLLGDGITNLADR